MFMIIFDPTAELFWWTHPYTLSCHVFDCQIIRGRGWGTAHKFCNIYK